MFVKSNKITIKIKQIRLEKGPKNIKFSKKIENIFILLVCFSTFISQK